MKLAKPLFFFICLALMLGPWVAFIISWIAGFQDVTFELSLLLVHLLG